MKAVDVGYEATGDFTMLGTTKSITVRIGNIIVLVSLATHMLPRSTK